MADETTEAVTTKEIKLEYTNAVAGEERYDFSGEYASIAEAVKALVATFEKDFNPANIDFEKVWISGEDFGLEGLYQAEMALKEFYN